ncbi:MAG: hypothetical protein HY078_15195 [Elusimicrobia bacterium]|nr:hypothetical protein [Elusimicrobiota bacterium]
MTRTRWRTVALAALFPFPASAYASTLDVGTFYRMRALSYSNLDLQDPRNNHSFISQNAQLSVFVKGILPQADAPDQTMDVGIALRGIGVAGSSTTLPSPFDTVGQNYPNTSFVPFLESAYVRMHQALGYPVQATFGQQPFSLGSGLLLADDNAGFAGVHLIGSLPFWEMKAGGFIFQPRNSQSSANGLMVYGFTLELPTDGVWQLNELVEKDKHPQITGSGLPVNEATRYFTSMRYQINAGPFVFDGEAAIQRGSAHPAGPSPANPNGTRVLYMGDAQVARAKWRQSFAKIGEGIARVTFARGSGYSGKTITTDETFFPSHGHRFDGLERSGSGDFFGATPYDAFGGKSSSTASGLPMTVHGIQTVGLGFTPPAYRGVTFDFDYFLFQADRNTAGADRTLGREMDFRLRYNFRDKLSFSLAYATFTAGKALSPSSSNARKYTFEAVGRF